jgi:hypothetical protein
LPEDYQYFKLQADPGELTIHYIEIGKDFQDLYEDDLELDYAGFKNLHYYSGETTLWLKSWNYFEDPGFLKWFEKNNIDPYDKTLGHGQIPLGIVDDVEGVKNKLIKDSLLLHIANSEVIKCVFVRSLAKCEVPDFRTSTNDLFNR